MVWTWCTKMQQGSFGVLVVTRTMHTPYRDGQLIIQSRLSDQRFFRDVLLALTFLFVFSWEPPGHSGCCNKTTKAARDFSREPDPGVT